jgi:hypothetical protein
MAIARGLRLCGSQVDPPVSQPAQRLGDLIKPARTLRLGISRLVIPAVQHDWIGAGLMAIARGLRAVDLMHSIFSGNVGIHRNGTR